MKEGARRQDTPLAAPPHASQAGYHSVLINKGGSRSPIALKTQGQRNWVTSQKQSNSCSTLTWRAVMATSPFTCAPSRGGTTPRRSGNLFVVPPEVCQWWRPKWVTDNSGPVAKGGKGGGDAPYQLPILIDRSLPVKLVITHYTLQQMLCHTRYSPRNALCHTHLSSPHTSSLAS